MHVCPLKKEWFILALGSVVFVSLCFFSVPAFGQEPFVPLAPLPGLTDKPDLTSYVNAGIRIGIGLAALLAVIMIVIGGIEYMGSDSFSQKDEGKKRITAAVGGLVLILGSFLILNIINPDLVRVPGVLTKVQLKTQQSTPLVGPVDGYTTPTGEELYKSNGQDVIVFSPATFARNNKEYGDAEKSSQRGEGRILDEAVNRFQQQCVQNGGTNDTNTAMGEKRYLCYQNPDFGL